MLCGGVELDVWRAWSDPFCELTEDGPFFPVPTEPRLPPGHPERWHPGVPLSSLERKLTWELGLIPVEPPQPGR